MQQRTWAAAGAAALLFIGCGGKEESVLPGVQALVFVKRAYERDDGSHDITGGTNQTIDYLRYVPGGGVYVLEPPAPNGKLRELTEEFDAVDINGIDVSFDGRQLAFSMRRKGDDRYHIYIANLTGAPKIRQVTMGESDDVKPIWVPGDRIAFMTNQAYTAMGTRADEYNHARQVTQVATVAKNGGDRRVCSQNLSHSTDPFLMSDGRIGFSRWEHLGPVNDVKLFAMNPDCTQMMAVAGQHDKPGNSVVQFQEMEEGIYVGIVTSRERTIQAGALVQVDARARSGASGIAFDEQHARFELLTPYVKTDESVDDSLAGRYRYPFPIRKANKLLVSWASGDVNDRNELAGTAPNFGIYLWDPSSPKKRVLVYDDPATWDLYAMPVAKRDIPPKRTGVVAANPKPDTPAILGSVDVRITSLNETVRGGPQDGQTLAAALKTAVAVRVIEGFSSEIGAMGMGQFGLTMHEGAAVLGEVPVQKDGSWEAKVPPYVPYHLQPIDEYGLSIRNQLLWIQAMPGEQRRCGGCHESRASTVLPSDGNTTIAQQNPVNLMQPIPDRMELPWAIDRTEYPDAPEARTVQDVLDQHCVRCHDGGADDRFAGRFYEVTASTMDGGSESFRIPYLNLSSEKIQAYYEREVVEYETSYVSLMYPSAMMGDIVVTGMMPERPWVIPGAARESRMIEVVNAVSPDGKRWAFPKREGKAVFGHPEDVGAPAMPREDRMMLIRMADLGGQYYRVRT